jgi:acyl-CoA synthetase (AMP-forming)/AMP-acid ligase II
MILTNGLRKVSCGAAPLGIHLTNRFLERFPNAQIRQLYGMTEILIATSNPFNHEKHGSIGVPVDGVSLKVVNTETGEELGPHIQGEILVKTPMVDNAKTLCRLSH